MIIVFLRNVLAESCHFYINLFVLFLLSKWYVTGSLFVKSFFFNSPCYISIEAPKLFQPLNARTELLEGSSARIMCYITTGTKPVFFKWNKDGVELATSRQLKYKIDNSEGESLLKIDNINRSDQGNYSCVAGNAFGSDIQSTVLSVKGLL